MRGRLEREHGFKDVEILGRRKFVDRMNPDKPAQEKVVVRLYTEEKGWVYAKIDPDSDAATDAFAAQIKAPVASRKPPRIGK